jgi:hypothetical protein
MRAHVKSKKETLLGDQLGLSKESAPTHVQT